MLRFNLKFVLPALVLLALGGAMLWKSPMNPAAPPATAAAADSSERPVPPIDAAAPLSFETATFAYGWFWGADSQFGSIPGVIRTRVGYTGGAKLNPTYRSLGNHTESLQIDYDPQLVSYEQLLGVFWASHNPAARPYSQQYKAAVFYATEQQRQLAEQTAQRSGQQTGTPVYTEVLPLKTFYRAEDYHQKYNLRYQPHLWSEITAFYGEDTRALADSTLAARLNGYAAGVGDAALLTHEVDSYGLSDAGRRYLQGLAPNLHAQAPGICGLSQ